MLNKPKNLPPEPYFSGYLNLLYQVFIYLRLHTAQPERMSHEDLVAIVKDIHDLTDALHNVPTFLREMDDWFTPENMEELYIRGYDERGAVSKKRLFQLSELLKVCIEEAQHKDNQ